jgi:hypothetical protein
VPRRISFPSPTLDPAPNVFDEYYCRSGPPRPPDLVAIVKSRGFGTFWIERQELDICRRTISLISAAETAGRAERTSADNQTVRSVFVIGPNKKIKLVLVYPMITE